MRTIISTIIPNQQSRFKLLLPQDFSYQEVWMRPRGLFPSLIGTGTLSGPQEDREFVKLEMSCAVPEHYHYVGSYWDAEAEQYWQLYEIQGESES